MEIASRYPQHPLAWKIMASLHRRSGRPGVALQAIERALQCEPLDASLQMERAGLLDELGRLDEAESACRRVLSAEPENGLAHSLLAAILMSQGRVEEAEALHGRAAELQPDSRSSTVASACTCRAGAGWRRPRPRHDACWRFGPGTSGRLAT
ncbi:hypothetical protein MASR1M6_27170 [Rubrivivax sp.]